MHAGGTLDPEEAARLERRWRARATLQRPAIALSWAGLTALSLHAGVAAASLVALVTSSLLTDPSTPVAGVSGSPTVPVDAVLAAASTATSVTWILLGVGLIAAGLAMRSGTHRALVQASAAATLPLGGLAIAELVWLAPCSIPMVALASAFHVSLALLGAWLALHLARPAGRDGFDEARG